MIRRTGANLVIALVVLGLAGCTLPRRDEAAPVTTYTTEAPPPASSAGAVVVASGDTVYSIARRYGIPTREIIDLNGLAPPYTLFIGQRLLLPTARFHAVQRGDTLYSISRMYQVDMAELARGNNLAPPYGIRVGQMLRLPGGGDAAPSAVQTAENLRAPIPRQKPGAIAVAQAPQTGTGVSAPPSGPVAAVVPLPPPMAKPAPAATVQSTQATQVAAVMAPATRAALPSAPTGKPVPAASLPAAVPAASGGTPELSKTAARPPEPPPPVQQVPPRTGSHFVWPVKGPILSSFGPKPGGLHNDGLNIGAPKGTPVVAAEDGIVAYAGNDLRGFGNLLLIRHADRWVSAYAHLDALLVERGAVVRRGQKIGTVGATGSVADPQLHFELRQGSRAVNPREHLAPAGDKVSRAAFRAGPPDPG